MASSRPEKGKSPPASSNTYLHLRTFPDAHVGIDWLEFRAVIRWSRQNAFDEIAAAQKRAFVRDGKSGSERIQIANHEVEVLARGDGTGNESRCKYVLIWNGVRMVLDPRQSKDRQLYNFRLTAKGMACTLIGFKAILQARDAILRELGGTITDSWIRRLDICADFPGLCISDELMPAVSQERYVSTTKRINMYPEDQAKKTSFSIDTYLCRISVYDKLLQLDNCIENPQFNEMKSALKERWRGYPNDVTRLEFRIRKDWFKEHSLNSVGEVLDRLGDICGKLANEGRRPLFRMTSSKPNTKTGKKQKTETLELWRSMMEVVGNAFGGEKNPLHRRRTK